MANKNPLKKSLGNSTASLDTLMGLIEQAKDAPKNPMKKTDVEGTIKNLKDMADAADELANKQEKSFDNYRPAINREKAEEYRKQAKEIEDANPSLDTLYGLLEEKAKEGPEKSKYGYDYDDASKQETQNLNSVEKAFPLGTSPSRDTLSRNGHTDVHGLISAIDAASNPAILLDIVNARPRALSKMYDNYQQYKYNKEVQDLFDKIDAKKKELGMED